MSALRATAMLEALETGRAARVTAVRHLHLSDDPFVLVPLGLAGEACAPLAVMCGTDRTRPHLLVVPQPRNRDQRFAFAVRLGRILLDYLARCRADAETYLVGRSREERSRYTSAPQLLVPNRGGVEFVRLLGRSTRLRRVDGPFAVSPDVPRLGMWLTWFADQAEHPGGNLLGAMTDALCAHWATGQSPAEDGNLAALLAWIDPPRGMDGAFAALLALDPAQCPPAGPATDPLFDQNELGPAMAAYDAAGSDNARAGALRILTTALESQLRPTWDLMWRGVDLLCGLRPGARVEQRWARDRAAFTDFSVYLDGDAWPQPRRDNAARAAQRLALLEEETAHYQVQRAFDDPMVMAEYELAGDAFHGTVVAVQGDRMVSSRTSTRSVYRPMLTVSFTLRPRIELGVTLFTPRRADQCARVLAIRPAGAVHETKALWEVDLQIEKGMGRRPPAVEGVLPNVGEEVCYTTLSPNAGMFGTLPTAQETPWTHGGPPNDRYEPTDDDAREEWQ